MGASGTFLGHVAAGLGFFAWGAWWLLNTPGRGRGTAPVEPGLTAPIAKIVFVAAMLVGEMPNSGWTPHDILMSTFHMTVYLGIGLTGVVDLLAYYGRVSWRATYIALAAAMFNAALLFAVHGNPPGAEAISHLLLESAWFAVGAFALLELALPRADLHWFRTGAMLVTGVWLLVISWILFRSGWDSQDSVRMNWIWLLFSWTVISVSAAVLAVRLGSSKGLGDPGLEQAA